MMPAADTPTREMELTEKIALSMTPGVTAQVVRLLDEAGITPSEFLRADSAAIAAAIGMNRPDAFPLSARDEAFIRARREMEIMMPRGITARFILDDDYPAYLREAYDAPVVIFIQGNLDINSTRHSLSVVGTRRCTGYGSSLTQRIVSDLAEYFPDLTVVSGMAYGIDAAAHRAAINAGRTTLAVVGHGLRSTYPAEHVALRREIVESGGAIITEYNYEHGSYRDTFLQRNRIVAGMTPLTLVAETPLKGGSINTVNTANNYSRLVAAFPGRVNDYSSQGCNNLIRTHQADLVTSAADIISLTGWNPLGTQRPLVVERNLFPELDEESAKVTGVLGERGEPLTVDVLHRLTGIPIARLMTLLTELEFDGHVRRLPGNRYEV